MCLTTATVIHRLRFRPLDYDSIPAIAPLLARSRSRTCDYTLAGLLMWARYFDYRYAVCRGTLFIKGVKENDRSVPAFSLPIGEMPLDDSIAMLRAYCREEGVPTVLSAVPEDRLGELRALGADRIEELVDWADYLYNARDLATLSGSAYSKKRNHVNRFASDHPEAALVELTPALVPDVKRFLDSLPVDREHATAMVERREVERLLDRWGSLPMDGAVLMTPDTGITAFAIGEVMADTLYVHVEKMLHDVNGAGETINKGFAAMMLDRYGVTFVNREEDAGDEGLRRAKESYHPLMMLRKYNVEF
ncbi:phosphatidylglycerol lysyltransferase domain-containing protein [uncultured Muribaculum sp.]|uniref:DUF2156 domain-containing protein n=1 Tax=uncultured Muribaculum sp. TaxID=1918613 RepID=UPI0025D348BE|nr:phosphatidylglycerol lysyltransferase domain-containing protein [uncultured Muribaculum sp.]